MSASQNASDDGPRGWMHRAACRDVADPDMFFPDSWAERSNRQAVTLCLSCPVKQDCRSYADTNGDEHGIWSGVQRHPPKYRTARRSA